MLMNNIQQNLQSIQIDNQSADFYAIKTNLNI